MSNVIQFPQRKRWDWLASLLALIFAIGLAISPFATWWFW